MTTGKIGFTFVLTGNARTSDEPLLEGGPSTEKNGCWVSLYIVPEGGGHCAAVRSAADGRPSDFSNPELQLISSYVDVTGTVISIRSDSQFHTEAGKRTYFELPTVGTNYTPKPGREDIRLTYGDQTAYLPGTLDVMLRYRALKVNERVENASPELATPGQLAWVDPDAALVTATGSLVDVVKEEEGQSELFLLGVLLGSLASVLQLLLTALYKVAGEIVKILKTA
jgi:hypothetical protein